MEARYEIRLRRLLLCKWRRLRRFVEEKFSARHGVLPLRQNEHEIYGNVDRGSHARSWTVDSSAISVPWILGTELSKLIWNRRNDQTLEIKRNLFVVFDL